MEITFSASYCSHGGYNPAKSESEINWVESTEWQNQHGKGRDFILNLIWFQISLEIYRQFLLKKALDEVGKELNNGD